VISFLKGLSKSEKRALAIIALTVPMGTFIVITYMIRKKLNENKEDKVSAEEVLKKKS
jgi:hypothetical protein